MEVVYLPFEEMPVDSFLENNQLQLCKKSDNAQLPSILFFSLSLCCGHL